MTNENLEKAFTLIETGISQEAEDRHWDAAGSFLEARTVLQQVAKEGYDGESQEEQQKIKRLLMDQCSEYLHRSRESLIEALQQEIIEDREENSISCQELSDEQAKRRNELFTTTFSKPVAVNELATDVGEDSNKVLEKQMSLEERLKQLNDNLPSGFKTPQERMQDLNQGMKRLGLSLFSSTDNPISTELPKSASQQVEDIIAQVTDEVAMEVADDSAIITGAPVSDKDAGLLSDEDSLSSSVSVNSLLSDEVPEMLNVSQIRDEVAATQAKLAELVSLLDTIPSGEEKDEKDEDPKETITTRTFDHLYGKQKLIEAKTCLHKALKLWKVKAKPI